jgi:hypothetical protein
VEQFLPSGALFPLCKAIIDGLVIGEQVKSTLRRVVAETQLEVPIRLHSSRCAVRKQIPFTRQERGFSITEACGDGLTQFSAFLHYEVGDFSSEGQRQVCCITGHQSRVQPAPTPSTAPQITESVSTQPRHRPAQDYARRVGVRLRENCLALQTLRQCAAINSQTWARQAIRLVEISPFVENAPLTIEVIHFASVTYVWHLPCISRYCRNVDSQIQQPMMSRRR